MPFQISDGDGKGIKARVGCAYTLGRLDTSSRSAPRMFYSNRSDGQSYVAYSDVTPTAAADVFFYLKNTSKTRLLYLDWYRLWCGENEGFNIMLGQTGTPGGSPTAITPINMNLTVSHSADVTCYEDPDITGLDAGTQLDRVRILANVDSYAQVYGSLILGENDIVTLQAVTGGNPVEVSVGFYME